MTLRARPLTACAGMEFLFQQRFFGDEYAWAVLWSKIAAGTVKMSVSPKYCTGLSLSSRGPRPYKVVPGGKLDRARQA